MIDCTVTTTGDVLTITPRINGAVPNVGQAVVINPSQIVDVQAYQGSLTPPINLPTYIEDTVFPADVPFEAMNDAEVQWKVYVHLLTGVTEAIPMGRVTNELSWTNNAAGAALARAAIIGLIPT